MSFYANGTNSGDNEHLAKFSGPYPNTNAAYSICGWVKPRVLPGTDGRILWCRCGVVNDEGISHTTTGDIVMIVDGVASAGYPGTLNEWVFVAIVRTSTTSVKLFVDHVEIAEDTTNVGARPATTTLNLGAAGFSAETPHCMLGRWRAWESALSAGELLTEAGSATAVKSGCWGDYRMQSGAVEIDSSGNARDFSTVPAYDSDEPPLGGEDLAVEAIPRNSFRRRRVTKYIARLAQEEKRRREEEEEFGESL